MLQIDCQTCHMLSIPVASSGFHMRTEYEAKEVAELDHLLEIWEPENVPHESG